MFVVDRSFILFFFFFFNDTATTEIYTLSLHDALPIYALPDYNKLRLALSPTARPLVHTVTAGDFNEDGLLDAVALRSEEHTSELQSHVNLVCRLLLEKKKKKKQNDLSYFTYMPEVIHF